MATTSLSLCKFAAFASKFRHLPAANRCLYLTSKQYQFSRRFSSVEEENKSPKYATSQDLQLSDSCVKVSCLCNMCCILQCSCQTLSTVTQCNKMQHFNLNLQNLRALYLICWSGNNYMANLTPTIIMFYESRTLSTSVSAHTFIIIIIIIKIIIISFVLQRKTKIKNTFNTLLNSQN